MIPVAAEFQKTLGSIAREARLPQPDVDLSEQGGGGSYVQDLIGMSPQEVNPGVSTGTVETSWHEFRHHQDGTWNLGNIKALIKMKFSGDDSYSVKPIGAFHSAADKIGNLEAWSNKMNTPGAGLDLAKQIVDAPSIFTYISGEAPGWKPDVYSSILEKPADFTDGRLRAEFKELMENRIRQLTPRARNLYMNYVTEPAELRAYSTGILGRMRAQAWGLPEPVNGSTYKSMPDSLLQYKQQ